MARLQSHVVHENMESRGSEHRSIHFFFLFSRGFEMCARLWGVRVKERVVCVFVFAVICGLPAWITRTTIVSVTQQMSLIDAVNDNNLEASDQGSRLIP